MICTHTRTSNCPDRVHPLTCPQAPPPSCLLHPHCSPPIRAQSLAAHTSSTGACRVTAPSLPGQPACGLQMSLSSGRFTTSSPEERSSSTFLPCSRYLWWMGGEPLCRTAEDSLPCACSQRARHWAMSLHYAWRKALRKKWIVKQSIFKSSSRELDIVYQISWRSI